MTLTLYNTLTRQKEAFEPIDDKNVRMYVCGPTVYDYAHIGNARPVIVFDVLFRLLRHIYGENHVTYARNITDVDDKINARALETHGEAIAAGTMTLNEAIREVTEKTANQFQDDMKALGCLEPTHQPRATDFILPREDGKADMVSMIQTLIDKDHAYIARGSQGREALFSVKSMPEYGALSKRKLDEQVAGARVAVESHKRDPGDFVLWKESNEKEPGWEATFTISNANRELIQANSNEITIKGRPGWHIECSAMSEAYLTHPDQTGPKAKVFDIHGGGLDLIFPHHENELAQSRCCHGTDVMANVWMHNEFLRVEGEKMSKSLGNFHTVHDVLHTEKVGGRKWPGEVVRLAMLMTHYREPIDFTVRRLELAERNLDVWRKLAGGVEPYSDVATIVDATRMNGSLRADRDIYDDLNIAKYLSRLHYEAKLIQRDPKNLPAARILKTLANFLGLTLTEAPTRARETNVDNAALKEIVDERLAFIADKNWAEADRIRDELLSQGIQLKDSKNSETGERITTWEVKR